MVIINEIYEDFNEKSSELEDHSHNCIDELIVLVKAELNKMYALWDQFNLSCTKIKETLKENGVDLYHISEVLEKLNNLIEEKVKEEKVSCQKF